MTDKNRSYKLSNAVSVRTTCATGNLTWNVYPNPLESGGNAYVQISNPNEKATEMRAVILTITGQKLLDRMINIQPGNNQVELPASDWAKGYYIIYLSTAEGTAAAMHKN